MPAGRRLAINGMLNFSGMWLYISSAALAVTVASALLWERHRVLARRHTATAA